MSTTLWFKVAIVAAIVGSLGWYTYSLGHLHGQRQAIEEIRTSRL